VSSQALLVKIVGRDKVAFLRTCKTMYNPIFLMIKVHNPVT